MIVAGMSLLIIIFAVAGSAAVRTEPELGVRNNWYVLGRIAFDKEMEPELTTYAVWAKV
jgi:hypothetical protein